MYIWYVTEDCRDDRYSVNHQTYALCVCVCVHVSKMAHFVLKCNKEDYLSVHVCTCVIYTKRHMWRQLLHVLPNVWYVCVCMYMYVRVWYIPRGICEGSYCMYYKLMVCLCVCVCPWYIHFCIVNTFCRCKVVICMWHMTAVTVYMTKLKVVNVYSKVCVCVSMVHTCFSLQSGRMQVSYARVIGGQLLFSRRAATVQ